MPHRLATAKARAVGTRQTLRAIEKGIAEVVFVAQDAEERVTRPVVELARRHGVQCVPVESMSVLGKYCEINVGAAAAALLRAPLTNRATGSG
ncbi:MAG: ribosomal L7Ae/L30e/S12e/Gadd45 family protein [Limnochordales bacterium]|nr:ribosomal L7Ae/L30e/S12e/Gadd45 family protein [Limnochordales bacterium]